MTTRIGRRQPPLYTAERGIVPLLDKHVNFAPQPAKKQPNGTIALPSPENMSRFGWQLVQVGEAFKVGTRPRQDKSCMWNLFARGCFGLRGHFAHCEMVFVWRLPASIVGDEQTVTFGCGICWGRDVWVEQRSWKYYNNNSWEIVWLGGMGRAKDRANMNLMWEKALQCRGKPFNWTGFLLNFTVGRLFSPLAYDARGEKFFCSELTATIKTAALEEYQKVRPYTCIPTKNYTLLHEHSRRLALPPPTDIDVLVQRMRVVQEV